MSRRTVIVDGYNLILRTPKLQPGPERTLEESREKLVNLLSWTMGGDQAKFIVVFDGTRAAGRAEKGTRVDVMFSTPPHSADDVIRELVEKHMDRDESVTVVTADLEVARHARAMGADIALSDLFLASTLGPGAVQPGEAPEDAEKPATVSKKELEEWAALFRERQGSGIRDDDDDEPGTPPTVH